MTDVGHTKQRYSGALILSFGFLWRKRNEKTNKFLLFFGWKNRSAAISLYQRCLALCGVNREFRMNFFFFLRIRFGERCSVFFD